MLRKLLKKKKKFSQGTVGLPSVGFLSTELQSISNKSGINKVLSSALVTWTNVLTTHLALMATNPLSMLKNQSMSPTEVLLSTTLTWLVTG